MPYYTGPHGEILGSVKRKREFEEMVRAFSVASMGRKEWGRARILSVSSGV